MKFKYILLNIRRNGVWYGIISVITMCVIFMLLLFSLMSGMTDELLKRTTTPLLDYHSVEIERNPEIDIYPRFFEQSHLEKVLTSFENIDYLFEASSTCFADIMALKPDNYTETMQSIPFTIKGITETTLVKEFISGQRFMISGEMLNENDFLSGNKNILISDEIAAINGLNIGDFVEIIISDYKEKFLIKGFFRETKKFVGTESNKLEIAANTFYIPISAMSEDFDKSISRIYLNFGENGPVKSFEKFINENNTYLEKYNLIASTKITLISEHERYLDKMQPIIESNRLFKILTVITCLCSIIFLSLLLIMFFISRKKQMAIMSALGISKNVLIGSIVTEIVLMIAVVSVIFMLILFPVVNNISNNMFNQTIEKTNESFYSASTLSNYSNSNSGIFIIEKNSLILIINSSVLVFITIVCVCMLSCFIVVRKTVNTELIQLFGRL